MNSFEKAIEAVNRIESKCAVILQGAKMSTTLLKANYNAAGGDLDAELVALAEDPVVGRHMPFQATGDAYLFNCTKPLARGESLAAKLVNRARAVRDAADTAPPSTQPVARQAFSMVGRK